MVIHLAHVQGQTALRIMGQEMIPKIRFSNLINITNKIKRRVFSNFCIWLYYQFFLRALKNFGGNLEWSYIHLAHAQGHP